MNPAQLLAHFDRISEAPDAIPCFRRFVLDLAVRGKLVEQDPNDQLASDLLKRTRASGARLPPEARPFSIPASWAWVPVHAIGTARLGKMLDKGKNKGTPRRYLRNVNVRWFDFDLSDVLEMRFEDSELEEFSLRGGDVLICEGGEPGRAAVWDGREADIYFQKAIHRVRFAEGVNPHYFANALRQGADSGRLSSHFTGVTIKHLTGQGLAAVLVPLPPLAEQHRIVAKVDEFMALCDRLEAAHTERESRRDRLVAASLDRLSQPADAADTQSFRGHARFHITHLPQLTTRPEHIQQLRETILNLAVRGRLVNQDPNDEPARELLKRIDRARKHRRTFADMAEGELESPLPQIPEQWAWTVVDRVSADDENAITDGPFGANLKTEHYVASPGFRVIRLQNVGQGVFREQHRSYIDASRFRHLSKHRVFAGDLIVAGLVDPRVRCCELPPDVGPAVVKADCYRLSVHPQVSSRFALHYLNSPTAQEFASAHHHGMTLTRIGLGNFRRIPFPVPPLAQQHRIVAKIDELMALCDRLEAQVTIAQTESRRLLEAVLHEALGPAA